MANFLRYSRTALNAIPEESRFEAHAMYEDTDLDGAVRAEHLFDYLESIVPGEVIGILANDSVTPPCCNRDLHYECDFYDPHWYTIFVSAAAWELHRHDVMLRDQQWKDAHGCKQASAPESEASR